MIIDKQFCDIVNAELERQGKTRADLARTMGVHQAMVTQYLGTAGGPPRSSPGTDVMERFLRALGLTPRLEFDRVISRKKVAS